jgi:hypothetical protein
MAQQNFTRVSGSGERFRQRHGFEHGLGLVLGFLEFCSRVGVVDPAAASLQAKLGENFGTIR